MDQNRYEEVPQKENKFLKGLKAFGKYIKFVFFDFFNSFRYNNMKLSAILFALPGLFLGFFMFAHVPTIRKVQVSYSKSVEGTNVSITQKLDTATDYKLTFKSYTIDGNEYTDVVLKKDALDKTASGFNPAQYPIDGEASEGKTKALSAIKVSSIALNNTTSSDLYTIKFDSIKEDEVDYIESYSIFIYEKASNDQFYQVMFGNKVSVTIDSDTKSYVATYDFLDSSKTYQILVKANASAKSEYYSSPMSAPLEFTPTTNGSKYTRSDYAEYSTKYIRFQGDYSVESVNGSTTLDDNMSNFNVSIKANGDAVYKAGDNSLNVRLLGGADDSSAMSSDVQETIMLIPFDFSAIAIFALTLFGFLSVFISLELSKKKNLGSVIKAALITGAIIIIGGLYIYAITQSGTAIANGYIKLENVTTIYDSNCITSIGVVIASAVFSLAGLILAFINYDRTYEKVDR